MVRKALRRDFAYILDELLHMEISQLNKEDYYHQIINTVIELNRADNFIIAICNVMQRLAVDRLHIIGDIYDRGPYPHKVMDRLMAHHDVDMTQGQSLSCHDDHKHEHPATPPQSVHAQPPPLLLAHLQQ